MKEIRVERKEGRQERSKEGRLKWKGSKEGKKGL